MIDPISEPEEWDAIVLGGGAVSPGVCVVAGFKRVHTFDKKKGKGTNGATLTFTEKPPTEGTVTFTLWQRAHFAAWDEFSALLKYDPTRKAVQAIDVFHPALAQINATSFVCEELGSIERADDLGNYSVQIKLVEFFPPPKATNVSTPTKSDANTFVGPLAAPPDPDQDLQDSIQAGLRKASAP